VAFSLQYMHIVVFGRPLQVSVRLCYGTLFVLSVPSATLVYCGQTVGWLRIQLGKEVSLSPGNNVLDGEPTSPTERGTLFGPMSIVAKRSPMSATAEVLSDHPSKAYTLFHDPILFKAT